MSSILDRAGKGLKRHSGASQTEAGPNDKGRRSGANARGPDLVDAINQIFAEFELAYHNQYHKAYGDSERLILAKKYWLECLSDFQPRQLVAAARQLVKTHDFLPTISAVIRACEQGHALYGLPSVREAYFEACRAPAPKAAYDWSHPAVYHAGKATDWFVLASEPEDKVYPLFAHNYQQLCDRVMRGEPLAEPVAPALPATIGTALSYEEQEQRLQALRDQLHV